MAQLSSARQISFPEGGLHLGEGMMILKAAGMTETFSRSSCRDIYTTICMFLRYPRNICVRDRA